MTARSWLFVPGDTPSKLEKAPGLGADALIVDLEDAVLRDTKDHARRVTADWLASRKDAPLKVWVRVNNDSELLVEDIAAVVGRGLAGVVVPKISDPRQAAKVVAQVATAEARAELDSGSVGFVPMIETARAVLAAAAIARVARVTTLMVGEYDLSAELGIDPSPDRHELATARAMVVLACSAAGIASPIAPVSADFGDLDGFRSATDALRREGHQGRAVIHPAQIGPANEVFTPSGEAIAHARRLLDLYDAAMAGGTGVCVDEDGNLIDEAIVRVSRQTLAAAAAAGRE